MTAEILTAVQTIVDTVADFDSSSIVINDWSFLDGPRTASPWCRIETGGLIEATYPLSGYSKRFLVPVIFVVAYDGEWDTSRAELAALRMSVIDAVDGANAALPSVGDTNYRSVERIADVNPSQSVQPVLTRAFLDALEIGDAIPDYLQLATTWEILETC